jgi:membrane-bound ClpP family serine protease
MSELKKTDRLISAKDKLLTLDAEELLGLHVADFPLTKAQEVLTLPPFEQFSDPELIHYSSWKIDFFALLTHPFVASLLMMGLMLGVYMEVQHPGMVFPGALAALCLGLIVLSQFAFQAIAWLEVLFVLAGIGFLVAELWLFPGVFLCGVLGIILFLVGLLGLLIPSWNEAHFSWILCEWNLAALQVLEQLKWFMASFLVSLIAMAIAARYLMPALFKRTTLILSADQEGYVAGLEKKDLPSVGTEGMAISPLLPGGKVEIDTRVYSVLSASEFIERGEKVYVSKIQGGVIFVRKK